MYYTIRLSASVFLPVSFRSTKTRGYTPTMLLTTSSSDSIDSSPVMRVMMAWRRQERDNIQSRCSAPFKRLTKNSVIEKGSKDPKTEEDTFCKRRFSRRRSNTEYSNSLRLYPLPRHSPLVSANTCNPPKTATTDAEPPKAATTDPNIDK